MKLPLGKQQDSFVNVAMVGRCSLTLSNLR
jgi:hypothetical protein